MRRSTLLLVLSFALALPAWAQSPAVLRVGLWTLWHDREVVLAPVAEQKTSLRLCADCALVPLQGTSTLRAQGGQLRTSDGRLVQAIATTGPVQLTAHGERVSLPYSVHIAARQNELTLSVTLPVERYVERVVASESGPEDSFESMAALAVVVRSYALHQAHGHAEYQLCDSTHCQLLRWGQPNPRQALAHAATLATAGETLWFHGRRVEAWFHQSSGGQTAAPEEIWPERNAATRPWLATHADDYSTARNWTAELSRAELTRALAEQGLAQPGWNTLVVARRGASGRVTALRAGSAEFTGEQLRMAVGRSYGYGQLLSDWFEVSQRGDRFVFTGRGSGHGVGLSQTGAAAMATAGHNAQEILAYSFPGATVADETSGHLWQSFAARGLRLESLDAADAHFLPELQRARAKAEQSTGIHAENAITVRAFASTETFRQATLAPGWVAGFTEGNWIGIQPLRVLESRKLLTNTLRHELTHALVESHSGPAAQLWLREGLAELWAGEQNHHAQARPALRPDEVDRQLAHAATLAESEAAHRAAAWYAARLLDRHGRASVLQWLRTGVPANVVAALAA